MLTRLVSSVWGAGDKTLCTAALSLFVLTAEYCALVWCRSVNIRLIGSVPYDAFHIVTRCCVPRRRTIYAYFYPRLGVTVSLANGESLDSDHMLNS